MKSAARGKNISDVEVLNISKFGIWLLADGVEIFASYEEFPWFRKAVIDDILNVCCPHPGHLYWPKLDIDLSIESLVSPEKFPLIAKKRRLRKISNLNR